MKAFGFKAGIGTASRMVGDEDGGYTVGALVQANFGIRERLMIDGVPVGREIPRTEIPGPDPGSGGGSVIVILATDAPLLAHQCRRLAQRAALGIARTGGGGENDSGDLFLAFATGNRGLNAEDEGQSVTKPITMLDDDHITALFWAAIEATEEAVINSLLAAETMTGNGVTFHALPADRLLEVMARYGRGAGAGPSAETRLQAHRPPDRAQVGADRLQAALLLRDGVRVLQAVAGEDADHALRGVDAALGGQPRNACHAGRGGGLAEDPLGFRDPALHAQDLLVADRLDHAA